MNSSSRRRFFSFVGLILLIAGSTGCEDSERPPRIRGQLVRAEDGTPIASLKVNLFDLENSSAVDLVESDADGVFEFNNPEPGEYLPVVQSADRVPFGLPSTRYVITDHERYDVVLPLAVVRDPIEPGDLMLQGRVIAAADSTPVAFARVEMNSFSSGVNLLEPDSNWSEFRGSATMLEPVTDTDGRFTLGPVPSITFVDPITQEQVIYASSWRVSAPGYKTRQFDRREVDSFRSEVTVLLEEGEDVGSICGRVIDENQEPAVGVAVHVEWRRGQGEGQFPKAASGSLGRMLPPDPDAITDENGRFCVESLPPGGYNVVAGAPADDGWVGIVRQGVEIFTRTPDVELGDLIAARAIETLAPANQAVLAGDITLSWAPINGAVTYQVIIIRGDDLAGGSLETTQPRLRLLAGSAPLDRPALLRWEVVALDANENGISITDRPQMFRFAPPDTLARR